MNTQKEQKPEQEHINKILSQSTYLIQHSEHQITNLSRPTWQICWFAWNKKYLKIKLEYVF